MVVCNINILNSPGGKVYIDVFLQCRSISSLGQEGDFHLLQSFESPWFIVCYESSRNTISMEEKLKGLHLGSLLQINKKYPKEIQMLNITPKNKFQLNCDFSSTSSRQLLCYAI